MSAGVRALALLLVAGCARSSGGDDPVAASVRAGIAAQFGIAPGRVVCADDRCLAEVGGLPVPIAVAGGAEATWQTDEIVVSFVYADVDYAGLASVWVLERVTSAEATAGILRPLARGIALPDDVCTGVVSVIDRALTLVIDERADHTRITASAPS